MDNLKENEMQDFRNLLLWHSCRQLILKVFRSTSVFPESALEGLANQIRNSCVAITSNIVLAFRKNNAIRMSYFISLGISKVENLKANLNLAKQDGWLDSSRYDHLINESNKIKEMLSAFVNNSPVDLKFELD